MRNALLPTAIILVLTATQLQAAGNLYRYKNDKGVLVIEKSIPPEYAGKGYQIISPAGYVVETVQPAATTAHEDETKQKRLAEAEASRNDSTLRKLYSAPADAERLRDRQLSAIANKIDFAKGQLNQLTAKRNTELENAAKRERQGKPPMPGTQDDLSRLDRQIVGMKEQIEGLEVEKKKTNEDFMPVIERLKVIYPNKTSHQAASTPPTMPASATPASTTPATRAQP